MPAYAETPVVFITASVQAEEQARLLALGAMAVIAKPFDPMTLAAQFRAVIAAGGMAADPGAALEALRQRFLAPRRRGPGDATGAPVRRQVGTAEDLKFAAHRLAGAAATFGFPKSAQRRSNLGGRLGRTGRGIDPAGIEAVIAALPAPPAPRRKLASAASVPAQPSRRSEVISVASEGRSWREVMTVIETDADLGSRMSWRAVIAGAVIAVAIGAMLNLLGRGHGRGRARSL